MLRETVWGHWLDEFVPGADPAISIVIFPKPGTGIYAWQVKDRTTGIVYAASHAPSLDAAHADALKAIEKGALEIALDAPGVWVAGRRVARGWEWRATLFRRAAPGVWVGFHAGEKLTVVTSDARRVPHLIAERINQLNETR